MILKTITFCLVTLFGIGLLVFAQQQPAGAVVRGRVVYEDTGAPLRRAWVGLILVRSLETYSDTNVGLDNTNSYAANAIGDSDAVVLTDDNGNYVLKDVAPGIYFPIVKQIGIANPTLKDVSDPRFQQLTVVGNEEIKFDIAAKRGGSIEGTVRYQDGSSAIGVNVKLESANDIDREIEDSAATTDDRGVFRFAGLREGDYLVSVSESVVHSDRAKPVESYEIDELTRNSILKTYFPGTYEPTDSSLVAVNLGAAQSNIDITLPNHPFVSASGFAVAANDSAPVPGLQISFRKISETNEFLLIGESRDKVVTKPDGSWAFSYLLPGTYEFSVERDDELIKTDSAGKQRKLGSVRKIIEITEGSNENIVIELPFAATISGTIELANNKPISNGYLFIGASSPDSPSRNSAFVRAEEGQTSAAFSLDDVSAGEVNLSVYSSLGYVVEINVDGKNVVDELIKIEQGQIIDGVRIILSDERGTIKGRVTNMFADIGMRRLYLVPADYIDKKAAIYQRIESIDLSPDGSFEKLVRPDRYYLVSRDSPKPETPDFDVAKLIEDWVRGAEIVEIKSGETIERNVSLEQ